VSKNINIRTYKTIILPVILYGCETWSLTLREEHRLKVFENRMFRIFGPRRYEVTGGWRKLHNEEFHNLYSPLSIIMTYNDQVKEDEMGRACSTNEEKRSAYRILMGEPEGKRPLGRPSRRWVDNTNMVLTEIGWDGMD
jgi:hypothetical protein